MPLLRSSLLLLVPAAAVAGIVLRGRCRCSLVSRPERKLAVGGIDGVPPSPLWPLLLVDAGAAADRLWRAKRLPLLPQSPLSSLLHIDLQFVESRRRDLSPRSQPPRGRTSAGSSPPKRCRSSGCSADAFTNPPWWLVPDHGMTGFRRGELYVEASRRQPLSAGQGRRTHVPTDGCARGDTRRR